MVATLPVMGNELIVITVASESLMHENLFVRGDDGRPRRLREIYADRDAWMEARQHLRDRHPDAYYLVPVPLAATWAPPAEPRRKKGATWIPAHRRAMTRSLLEYLNGRLAGLDQMLRTGAFVIERARVLAVTVKPVPEYAWKRFAAEMKNGLGGTSAKPAGPKA